jgi:homoserine kinase
MFERLRADRSELALTIAGSTSNLGPGFDLCGLAVSLRLRIESAPGSRGSGIRVTLGAGTEEWPRSGGKLVDALRSIAPEADLELSVASEIPVSRGLGSSGAAIVAGLVLGAALLDREVGRDELLARALALEGHPDNVTPALLGGCVLSVPRGRGQPPLVVRQEVHPSLAFAVAWPAATLETGFARSLLPAGVPFADAVENPRRLALLLEGLRRADPELLRLGSEDRLHVPYRLPRIPGGTAALDAAREAGAWLATISGSGSALFAIASLERASIVADAMRAVLDRASPPARARVVDLGGPASLVSR